MSDERQVERDDDDGLMREALAFVPVARGFMDDLRARLPDGTHFGVFVLVPGEPEGRVVAMTTDRDVVGPAVAQWFLSTKQD